MSSSHPNRPLILIDGGLKLDHALLRDAFAEHAVELRIAANEADFASHISEAYGVLVNLIPIDGNLISRADRCRIISRFGVGYDNIDVAAARKKGILVANVVDYCAEEVSDHAIGLMFNLVREIVSLNRRAKNGEWPSPQGLKINRVRGSTLGLVGLGRIGRLVADKALALGMKVVAYDPDVPKTPKLTRSRSLSALLGQSDIVSLHIPLTPETRHILDAKMLSRMREGAALINVSRGGLVDEKALYEALTKGRISGAALDVFELEPPGGSPLLTLDNVIATPHVAWYSQTSMASLQEQAAGNIVDVLENRAPANLVAI